LFRWGYKKKKNGIRRKEIYRDQINRMERGDANPTIKNQRSDL